MVMGLLAAEDRDSLRRLAAGDTDAAAGCTIVTRLEEPLGTVKTRIRLGLLKLRDALAEGPS